jgi:alpha-tubulin suppressor-like RCC1 family protein
LALKTDGTVYAWGRNNYGQLGDNTTTDRLTPVQVQTITGIIDLDAGNYHSLALKSDGTAWGWGYNYYGQLGNNSTTDSNVAVIVLYPNLATVTGMIEISAGGYHSLARKPDGTIWSWGSNYYGELGDDTSGNEKHTAIINYS